MSSLDSLRDLMEDELKDLYDAEKQLTKALPKLIKKASTPQLSQAFEDHLRQTETHIERLKQVFGEFDMPVRGKECVGMKNLIKEGDEMIAEAEEDATRDALIIAAAQKVEHYEIASYGTLRTWASVLGQEQAAQLLEETLNEEKDADQKLTGIAESSVNYEAAEEEDARSRQKPATKRGPRKTAARAPRYQAADQGRAGAAHSKRSRSRSR
jgi:ferritin-like metal-binding protein YciE